MFMVAWQRLVLLGPHRIDRLPGLGWSSRETAWLGHLLKVAGMTFVLMAIFMITVGPMDPRALQAGAAIDPDIARRYALAGPLAFGFIVSLLLALRVSLASPPPPSTSPSRRAFPGRTAGAMPGRSSAPCSSSISAAPSSPPWPRC